MPGRAALLAVLAGASLAPSALATDVLTLIRTVVVDQGDATHPCGEVAVIASPLVWREAALAYIRGGGVVRAVTTLDAFQTFETPFELGGPVDPFVAASAATGNIFVGTFRGGAHPALIVWRKRLGQSQLSDRRTVAEDLPDPGGQAASVAWEKPFAAIGPWPSPHTTPEVFHINVWPVATGGYQYSMWGVHSIDAGELGLQWPGPSDDGYPQVVKAEVSASGVTHGDAPYPMVVPSGLHAGRLIVPYSSREIGPFTGAVSVALTYTDTAGSTPDPHDGNRRWRARTTLTAFGPPTNERRIYGSSVTGAYPFPSGSVDPTSPGTGCVAFVGSVEGGGPDIFVARWTTDDTSTGSPLVLSPIETARVTDAMIAPVGEGSTSETKPSIVIDSQHGVAILYTRVRELDGMAVVRIARWPSFESLRDGEHAFVISLTAPFTPWPNAGNFEYTMLALAGCHLIAAYPSRESGTWDMKVSVLRLNTECCQPDPGCWANCDGSTTPPVLNVADIACFLQRLAAGKTLDHTVQVTYYANCDGSTAAPVLNVADFTCFLQKFAAGCE